MQVSYSIQSNKCYQDNNGHIIISNIIYDSIIEQENFAQKTIQWTGPDIDQELSKDKLILNNLYNGIYTFKILSSIVDGLGSETYTVEITSPEKLEISKVRNVPNSCAGKGLVYIEITGGKAPFNYFLNSKILSSSDRHITFNDVSPGISSVSVIDSNGCSVAYEKEIEILDSSINITFNRTYTPTLLDSYGILDLNIRGYGPFELIFKNNSNDENYIISSFDTKYISNIIDNNYYYLINDLVTPGEYTLYIKDIYNCSIETSFVLSNILPLNVDISVFPDTSSLIPNLLPTIDIFDTLLIPYKHIVNNSRLWQTILEYELKDSIFINIDDNINEYVVIREMLNKHCIVNNEIEILKLGNTSKDWYYYLYVGPGINLSINQSLATSKIELLNHDTKEKFPITLGLKDDGNLDYENASLIKGSFILSDIGLNQFKNGQTINLNIGNSIEQNSSSYFLKNISVKSLKNSYSSAINTVVSFLQQFNVLNEYVSIGQTACNISNEDFNYIQNINDILRIINSFNNINNIYIYTFDNLVHSGRINFNINSTANFLTPDGIINNTYNIEYFTFDKLSDNLQNIIIDNKIIKDIYNIQYLDPRYIIARIKDYYGNITRNIHIKNKYINYDDHYIAARQLLLSRYPKIFPLFQYGDILSYIPSNNDIELIYIPDDLIPTHEPPPQQSTPTRTPTRIPIGVASQNYTKKISQTQDDSNACSLFIEINPPQTKCVLFGPKNYYSIFEENVEFANLIPGVYIIKGDSIYLENNSLYQNETRINLKKNQSERLFINFDNYKNKILIKDIN